MAIRVRSAVLLVVLFGLQFLHAEIQLEASRLLQQALEAQGGEGKLRALRSVEWKLAGYRNEVEESERPEGPYIAEFDTTTEVHDFQHERYLSLTDANVYPVFTFSRGLIATDSVAMRVMNDKKMAGTPELVQVAHERLVLSPERILLTALDSIDTHLEPDTILQFVPQRVIAFTLDGAPVRVFLNAYTHLPTAVDYSGPMARTSFWAFLGDVTSRTLYGFWWLGKGGIHLPMQWNVEANGLPDQMMVVRSLKIDGELQQNDFIIPESVQKEFASAPRSKSPESMPLGYPQEAEREISPGVVLIPGAWNVTLIRQDDGIIVLEAPISSGYSEKVLAESHHLFPDLPVKAVITTSDAWPHIAGIREYVAEGIPIYALDLNRPILERVIGTPHSVRPDKFQRFPKPAQLHLVSDRLRLDSKLNPLEIIPIRGETTERQMMVFFPKSQLLYGSDAFQRNPDGTYNLPQTVEELMDGVAREHLNVSQYFMMHMLLSQWSELPDVLTTAKSQDSPDGVL